MVLFSFCLIFCLVFQFQLSVAYKSVACKSDAYKKAYVSKKLEYDIKCPAGSTIVGVEGKNLFFLHPWMDTFPTARKLFDNNESKSHSNTKTLASFLQSQQ